jgi:hypothetical protein
MPPHNTERSACYALINSRTGKIIAIGYRPQLIRQMCRLSKTYPGRRYSIVYAPRAELGAIIPSEMYGGADA